MSMSYNSVRYLLGFLPVLLLSYQVTPRKFRWILLLLFNVLFFWMWSGRLLVWMLISIFIAYIAGKEMINVGSSKDREKRKKEKKKKNRIKFWAILFELAILISLKYTNFIGSSVSSLTGNVWNTLNIAVPIGISYYTLQSISFIADVQTGKIQEVSLRKLALYMSFFPTIVEGPITRYEEVGDSLAAGESLKAENIAVGFERIIIGLLKKTVIADHLAGTVNALFAGYGQNGALAFLGAVFCTWQLYMDFSGTIDIAIGSAKMLGITLPENFRQPFFAKNAGDFWHRWHITLGTFFRDYIFYPVSLSKPVMKMTKFLRAHDMKWGSRYAGPALALLLVWLANGFWHGPHLTYAGYGLYYFVLMFIEMQLTKPFEKWCARHHLAGMPLTVFRFIKLFFIVIIGEMFFRASTFTAGWAMFCTWFKPWHLSEAVSFLLSNGLDSIDWIASIAASIFLISISVLKEKKFPIRKKFQSQTTIVRWGILYTIMIYIALFGAYGPGYDAIAMMYANF